MSNQTPFSLNNSIVSQMFYAVKSEAIDFINKHAVEYEINTKQRLIAFTAVCILNTIGFFRLTKGSGFTEKQPLALQSLYPTIFESSDNAKEHLQKGEAHICNLIYANKHGNGDYESGDGYRYLKRGGLGFKGKTVYEQLGLLDNPEILEDLEQGIIYSMKYWKDNGINELADKLDPTVMSFKGMCDKLRLAVNMEEDKRVDIIEMIKRGLNS